MTVVMHRHMLLARSGTTLAVRCIFRVIVDKSQGGFQECPRSIRGIRGIRGIRDFRVCTISLKQRIYRILSGGNEECSLYWTSAGC